MKIFKRTLSLVIAVCVLASMAVIATVSSSAVEGANAIAKTAPREGTITYPERVKNEETGEVSVVTDEAGNPKMLEATQQYGTRPVVSEVVNSDPDIQVKTKTYRFYMPDSWFNDRNDNYDGVSLDSCSAGIYWWTTSYNADDYKGENAQGWPGFRILEQDPDDPHIFICEVPEDAGTIIFNNTVDAGQTHTNPNYALNYQTVDISTIYMEPIDDPYAFYETTADGKPITEDNPMTFGGMIYVVNPVDTTVNEFSGATTTKGEWFYYYGEGKYGTTPMTGTDVPEGFFTNGDFPSSLQISDTSIFNYLNNDPTYEVYCNADPSTLKVTSNDESVATVSAVSAVTGDAMWKSKVTITGVTEGDTSVVFEQTTVDDAGKESKAYRTCTVENTYLKPRITASAKSLKVGKTAKIATVLYAEKVTYKSSKTSVATVSSSGVVTAKAAGTATITITATAGDKSATATAKVTVTKNANTMTVKAKAVTASAKKNTSFAKAKFATVSKAVGKVTFKKASGDKKITITSAGKLTVKKGLKKGKTYSVKIKVTAAGSAKYAAATKTITVKVKVK
ncbi:MAG: Ig-like domain-containing protein [Ruminococcus sp.]|nr:Ig-like domain-containing protein [Ruminococcus sp.]